MSEWWIGALARWVERLAGSAGLVGAIKKNLAGLGYDG